MTLFLHLLNCFFLIFALFLSYSVRFGFLFEDLFSVFVQCSSGYDHLAGVNAHMYSCAISLLPLHSFNVDAYFFLSTWTALPICCPLWCPHTTWTSSFRMGMDRTLYFCLSSLERGGDIIFLQMWEGALKYLFRFLLRSGVTKGLNFILAAGASAMATEGKRSPSLSLILCTWCSAWHVVESQVLTRH